MQSDKVVESSFLPGVVDEHTARLLYAQAYDYALELSGDPGIAERVARRFLDVMREKPEIMQYAV